MASIKKREWTTDKGVKREAWRLRYTDAQGVERNKQFDKKADAEAYRIKVETEVVAGVHTPESTSVTVAQAADLFLDGRKLRDLERSSLDAYDGHIENHIKPLMGADKLSALTMPAVNAFAETLIKSGRSRATAVKVLSTFRSILKDAQGRGLVGQNVAIEVTVPVSKRRTKKKIDVPTKAELRAILEKAESDFPDFYPLVLTAVFTGLRSSELRGLRRVDIDLKGGTISVEQRADAWGVLGAPKSEAGFRTIPIPPMLVTVLRAWLLRAPVSHCGLAFPTKSGGVRLHSNMCNRELYPLLIAAGISEPTGDVDADGNAKMRARWGIHTLRHAAASAWIGRRVDLKRIQSWLGHASIQMTVDTYGHLMVDDEADAAVAREMEAALFG